MKVPKMILRIAVTCFLLATPALAQELAAGDVIRSAVSGNTVQGSMTSSGVYTEFYADDGAIKGQGYTGIWRIEGDTMCFTYGDTPATCLGARVDGDQITWVENGTDDIGTGAIVVGNPNGF